MIGIDYEIDSKFFNWVVTVQFNWEILFSQELVCLYWLKTKFLNLIPITLTINNGIIVNPVKLKALLSDSNSDKTLELKGEFIIK